MMKRRLSPSISSSRPLASVGLAALALALVAGCDSPGMTSKAKTAADAKSKVAVGQASTTSADLSSAGAAEGPGVLSGGLSVSEAIAKACGIVPREGKKAAPSFDYDSSALAEDDRELLAEVARCLTVGALRGRSVSLVGRADARGEPEYNMTLGESRADAVRRYLVDLGVGRDKAQATSRGEMDAVGVDERGWAEDRRVDLVLPE